jgi:choline dehydrogenase-like flavoprotein
LAIEAQQFMMSALIVGSGASGVHLAKTLVDLGVGVTMLDVGHERPEPVMRDADFNSLKDRLDDPAGYFLGSDGAGIVFPTDRARYYSHPPSKEYVFSLPTDFKATTRNFAPVLSFAAGGLAEAWTAGVYPLNDAELTEFPFDFEAIRPHYAEIVRRIGISAASDDLARFSAWFDDYLEPIAPDPHTQVLLTQYEQRREYLNRKLGFYLGRSRVATLSSDRGRRLACDRLGRCLWGCPRESLYTPSMTLQELRGKSNFRYINDAFVTHLEYDGDTVSAVATTGKDGTQKRFSAMVYALAAGTLCSSKILLDSIYRRTGNVHELPGLMDNGQIMAPFMTLRRLAKPVDTHAYQFHQLALGISQEDPAEYVHGQITTLKAASVHPVAQSLPLDLRSALEVFRIAHGALGAANVWVADRRRPENVLTIRPRPGTAQTELIVRCAENPPDRFDAPLRTLKRALNKLGSIVLPGMTQRLGKGASIHYAGTLPMQHGPRPFTCTPDCRSHDFRNLYFADGASFPFLPAKNLTFTLMANSVRIAHALYRELNTAAL